MIHQEFASEQSEVLITYSPTLHELHFTNASGEAVYPPSPLMGKGSSAEGTVDTPLILDHLVRLQQLTDGVGVISAANAAKYFRRDGEPTQNRTLMSHANAVVQYVPDEIFTYYRNERRETVLRCGSFAVATSLQPATPEEHQATDQRREQVREYRRHNGPRSPLKEQQHREKLDAAKEQVEAAEKSKVKLTTFDHATFHIGDSDFYLDFEKPIDFLIARFVSALNKAPAHQTTATHRVIIPTSFNEFVWNRMSIAERKLFARSEDTVFGGSLPISRAMKNIRTMLSYSTHHRRGLITARDNEPFVFPRVDIATNVHRSPRQDSIEAEKLILEKARLQVPRRYRVSGGGEEEPAKDTTQPSAEDLEWAEAWARRQRGALPHQDAIDALDKLMSREGKAAIRHVLSGESEADDEQFDDFMQRSHATLRQSLGRQAYWDAWRERVIAGTKATTGSSHKAEQIGGRLAGERTKTNRRRRRT